jgi:chromosome partitioning protein
MAEERTNLGASVAAEVRQAFPGKVFRTHIPRNIRLAEAPSHGKPVAFYDMKSKGAQAYLALAKEWLQLESALVGADFAGGAV